MQKQNLLQPLVKSVVAIFSENENRILFQFNKKDKELIRLPGGKIKRGESARDCVKREIKEEFLFDLKQIKLWIFFENFFVLNEKTEHEILIIHSAKLKKNKEQFPKIHSENSDIFIDWFEVFDLNKYLIVPKGVLEMLNKSQETIYHYSNYNNQ